MASGPTTWLHVPTGGPQALGIRWASLDASTALASALRVASAEPISELEATM